MNALILTLLFAIQPQPDNLVVPVSGAPQILIPVAGNTPGENGTHFRSDVSIINLRNVTQRVHLQWVPQVGNPGRNAVSIDISPGSGIRVEDFVGQVMEMTGLGSVVVSGMVSDQVGDPNAILYVTSRIWTPQPGTGGTTSQSLNTLPTSSINTPAAAIFGLRRDARYRVNVGVVNLDATRTQTFQIQDPRSSPTNTVVHTITLPPMTMQQIPLGRVSDDTPQILVSNITPDSTRSNLWVTYGSAVDNVTGDSWSELGLAGTPQN